VYRKLSKCLLTPSHAVYHSAALCAPRIILSELVCLQTILVAVVLCCPVWVSLCKSSRCWAKGTLNGGCVQGRWVQCRLSPYLHTLQLAKVLLHSAASTCFGMGARRRSALARRRRAPLRLPLCSRTSFGRFISFSFSLCLFFIPFCFLFLWAGKVSLT